MHYIDSNNAVDGKWVGWNSQTRARPTLGTPEWFNTMQEEIANVVLAAGLELDKNDNTQLLQAIGILISKAIVGGGSGSVSCQQIGQILEAHAHVDLATGHLVFECKGDNYFSYDSPNGNLLLVSQGIVEPWANANWTFDPTTGELTLSAMSQTTLDQFNYTLPDLEVTSANN